MNLKDYREKELRSYAIANILLVMYCTDKFGFLISIQGSGFTSLLASIINVGLLGSIAYCYVFILDSVISSCFKDRIIYWRDHKRPGNTIFSDIKADSWKTRDDRFLRDDVLRHYTDIYDELKSKDNDKERRVFENSKWYGIYRSHQTEIKIMVAHRDYLLCRDLTVMTVSLVELFILRSIILRTINLHLLIFLLAEYAICNAAARAKSQRFVNTVIAEDFNNNTKAEELPKAKGTWEQR